MIARRGPDASITAVGVSKAFGGVRAVSDATLIVEAGSITAVLGPSGSGKTTLLRLLAGFEAPDTGTVCIGDRLVAGPGAFVQPEQRRIGMVFQHGGLFPHLDVAGNVAFGARTREVADRALSLVGLADRRTSRPHELSGGERQRVALARALAHEPEVVLLDEPFSALDAGLRESLREEVAAILREAGTTALLVTHDQAEALALADAVAVMNAGCVVQAGTPEELYERPATRWVAGFLGDVDILPGTVHAGTIRCALGAAPASGQADGPAEVAVRPEAVAVGAPGTGRAEAVVERRLFFGHDQLLHLRLSDGTPLRSRRLGGVAPAPGDAVGVWLEGRLTVLPAEP